MKSATPAVLGLFDTLDRLGVEKRLAAIAGVHHAHAMRKRLWVALVFTLAVFVYAPMGGMFTPPAPPFGLEMNGWPFYVAAWRALNMALLVALSVGTGYAFSVGRRGGARKGIPQ